MASPREHADNLSNHTFEVSVLHGTDSFVFDAAYFKETDHGNIEFKGSDHAPVALFPQAMVVSILRVED